MPDTPDPEYEPDLSKAPKKRTLIVLYEKPNGKHGRLRAERREDGWYSSGHKIFTVRAWKMG